MIEKSRAKADKAFSPPLIRLSDWIFLPGGCTEISTPAVSKSPSVNIRSAEPPPNIWRKVTLKLSRMASKVDLKRSLTSSFISSIVSKSRFLADRTSSRCSLRKFKRLLTSSNCSTASRLTGPKARMAFSKSLTWLSAAGKLSNGRAWLLASSKLIW